MLDTVSQPFSPSILLPIEIGVRELDAKLMIAQEAMQRGHTCYAGSKMALNRNLKNLIPGAMIFKSGSTKKPEFLDYIKNTGHKVIVLDEEGLVQFTDEHIHIRFNPTVLEKIDALLCWGEKQKNLICEAFPEFAHKIFVTGNPRIDIWREPEDLYQDQHDKLKQKYGDFIFMCSAFGGVNHYLGKDAALELAIKGQAIRGEKDITFFKNYYDYMDVIYKAYIEFLPKLARHFSDRQIVVRPHPSDDISVWKKELAGIENLHVVFDGPVTPWIWACDTMLQWGSTTSIEAHILGKTVISYDPHDQNMRDKYALKLPNLVSVITQTEKETLDAFDKVIKMPHENRPSLFPKIIEGRLELKNWIDNLDGGNAAKKILDVIHELNIQPDHNSITATNHIGLKKTSELHNPNSIKLFLINILMLFYKAKILRFIIPKRLKNRFEKDYYRIQKVGEFNRNIISESLKKIKNVSSKKDIAVIQEISHELFELHERDHQ